MAGSRSQKHEGADSSQQSFADLLFPDPAAASLPGQVREAAPTEALTGFTPVYSLRLVRTDTMPTQERLTVSSPADASGLLSRYLKGADREHFVALFLDTKNQVTGIHTVSVGDLSSALVHPREVFKPAILANAASILVAHNHPSGDPAPSPEDVAITHRLCEAGELLGIALLDHVIIGEPGRWTSLKEKGFL
jgi:DNA repair protein RadC